MTKPELITKIAEKSNLSKKDAAAALTGKNPRTGEKVEISAKRVPAFKPAKALKDAVM